MLKVIGIWAVCLLAQPVFAQEPANSDKLPIADTTGEKASATASSAEKKDGEFNPPQGFLTKKRGDLVLYCKSDVTVGTRFKTEKCYNETQMRAYMLALEQQKNDIDRIRSTCGGGPCVPHEPPSPP